MTVQTLPAPTALPAVARAGACLDEARDVALGHVCDAELADLVTELARIESQAGALKLAVLAEAEARATAAKHAATGTDAWAATLTGDTREALAGGLRLARLLTEKYHHTRQAYASGALRLPQVKVIVHAAEQAPPEATPVQVAAAEELLVGKGTGLGTRSGRPMNAKRLRQAARRMFDPVDHALADAHEAILLGREAKHARRETYLMLCATTATAPPPGSSSSPSCTVTCCVTPSTGSPHPAVARTPTAARARPTTSPPPRARATGWAAGSSRATPCASSSSTCPPPGGLLATPSPCWSPCPWTSSPPGWGPPARRTWRPGSTPRPATCAAWRARPASSPRSSTGPRSPRRRPHPAPAHPRPAQGPGPGPRHLRHHRLRAPLLLVRDPPPPSLGPRWRHQRRQRRAAVLLAPPPRPRVPDGGSSSTRSTAGDYDPGSRPDHGPPDSRGSGRQAGVTPVPPRGVLGV